MTLRKYRWSRDYESAEEELVNLLAHKHIRAVRWVADEYQEFPSVAAPNDKRLWCVEGSIMYSIDGKDITLQAGDALDIPSSTAHYGVAGFSGCVCYESTSATINQQHHA